MSTPLICKKVIPRSPLQQLQSTVQWTINFSLHDISVHKLAGLQMTNETVRLIHKREQITKALKKSIMDDYMTQRANILNSRKANAVLLANKKKHVDRNPD